MIKFQVAGFLDNSAVNGQGLRSVLFLSGCNHKCYNCHNEDMQAPGYGETISLNNILKRIKSNLPLVKGVTISGGEPFYQWKPLFELLKELQKENINCWVYSGYTHDQIKENKDFKQLLPFIDVLVEGPFVNEKLNTELLYIGSSNQRILELANGSIINVLTF